VSSPPYSTVLGLVFTNGKKKLTIYYKINALRSASQDGKVSMSFARPGTNKKCSSSQYSINNTKNINLKLLLRDLKNKTRNEIK
jgi:hypothetical protein